ncbi:MAG: hypothetical protein LBV15_02250, partial [Planctomycetota bacterium]|nr:hypothetical protein [Planctomycetota bacterium]
MNVVRNVSSFSAVGIFRILPGVALVWLAAFILCGRLNAALSGEIVEVKLNNLASMKFVQIPAGAFM